MVLIHYCKYFVLLWRRGVVVITTAQLQSTKPELRFCAGSNPAPGVSEIRDGEDLWQWSRLEIRLNAFRRSTIPQKQFIIIIIIITCNIAGMEDFLSVVLIYFIKIFVKGVPLKNLYLYFLKVFLFFFSSFLYFRHNLLEDNIFFREHQLEFQ